ncbi:dynamin family protein, partial [Metallibacterium scheffleri]|uniref:dynamin family protein n=1 Tax=Metallibacterium scheffleri TaxID=993689 RepID=UPI0023F571D4
MTTNAIAAGAGAPAPAGTVAALIAAALAAFPHPSEAEARHLTRLRALAGRLAEARLQIAVVGQFKRGKSSLLNALLGLPVLPMGVVPLTAITTVLTAGPLRLKCHFLDGRQSEHAIADFASLRAELVSLVTEEENPANRLGLLRVEVS